MGKVPLSEHEMLLDIVDERTSSRARVHESATAAHHGHKFILQRVFRKCLESLFAKVNFSTNSSTYPLYY